MQQLILHLLHWLSGFVVNLQCELHYAIDKVLPPYALAEDPNISEEDKTTLQGKRLELFNLRSLSGTPEDVLAALTIIGVEVQEIVRFRFNFEPLSP